MRAMLLAACAVCCVASGARADTYSVGLGTPQKDADGLEYNVGFNDFDATLGMLTSATLTLSGVFTAGAHLPDPTSPPPAILQFNTSTLYADNIQIGSFGQHSAIYSPATESGSVYFGVSVSATLPLGFVQAGGGANFQGFDDYFNLHGGEGLLNSPGGDVEPIDTFQLAPSSITYTYTPLATDLPEPLSLALLAGGIACALGARRRYGVTAT